MQFPLYFWRWVCEIFLVVIVNGCGVQILSGNNLKVFSVAFNYMSFRHIHHIHMVRINILVSSFIYIYIYLRHVLGRFFNICRLYIFSSFLTSECLLGWKNPLGFVLDHLFVWRTLMHPPITQMVWFNVYSYFHGCYTAILFAKLNRQLNPWCTFKTISICMNTSMNQKVHVVFLLTENF